MTDQELIIRLADYVTEQRYNALLEKLNRRTRHIAIVLQNVHHEHNISAVIRTCECLGIQDLHIIQNSNKLSQHPTIDRGAEKWLTIYNYADKADNTQECIDWLKENGYRIVATTPHDDESTLPPTPGFGATYSMPDRTDSLYNYDITKGKTAIVIGSERQGISQSMVDQADDFITIPMYGFTESLNLSVCAAIIASHLRNQLSKSGIDPRIPADEQNAIMVQWLLGSIRNSEAVMKHIMQNMD